ncbi:hypothetical protein EBU71_00240 [bacterium]|nr:hypothetical protein [Candidatus Elulimicrobium humile]
MWIDPKKFKHYEMLKSLSVALQADYSTFSRNHNIKEKGINVFRYEYPNAEHEHADSWWAIPLIQGTKAVPNDWHRSTAVLKEIPGVFQSIVNFITPFGGLPLHKDFGSWQRIEESVGHAVKGWTIAIGIDMPSNDPKILGIEFENDSAPRAYANNEIVAFDGRNYMHKVWNKTGNWRVSAIVDTNETEWAL